MRALLLVDHHPPGVYLLVRSISHGRFVCGVVCSSSDLPTHDGSGSRLRVEQLRFGVFHCSSPFCSNFRMSKVPMTEPTAWDLYMQVLTYLQNLDRHRVRLERPLGVVTRFRALRIEKGNPTSADRLH
jgi:hypothetical protein